MAGVRDPAFWKRFSVAVHLDEEQGPTHPSKQADSWLQKETNKTRRRRFICPIFWLCLFIFIAGVVAVIIWMLQSGILNKIGGTSSNAAEE